MIIELAIYKVRKLTNSPIGVFTIRSIQRDTVVAMKKKDNWITIDKTRTSR